MNKLTQFLRKKKNDPFDPASLVADIHSHVIPGIDDGSPDLEESTTMLQGMSAMGFRKIITTPHVMHDYYKNSREDILRGLEIIREVAATEEIPLEIDAAAEYYCDEYFLKLIREDQLLTFGNRYVLFEFSFYTRPQIADQVIFEIQAKGYRPVLAHFERYPYFFQERKEWIEKLKEKGVLLQVNLLSLAGRYGSRIQKQAEWMVDEGVIDFVGTDSHHSEHLNLISAHLNTAYFRKLRDLPLKNKELVQET